MSALSATDVLKKEFSSGDTLPTLAALGATGAVGGLLATDDVAGETKAERRQRMLRNMAVGGVGMTGVGALGLGAKAMLTRNPEDNRGTNAPKAIRGASAVGGGLAGGWLQRTALGKASDRLAMAANPVEGQVLSGLKTNADAFDSSATSRLFNKYHGATGGLDAALDARIQAIQLHNPTDPASIAKLGLTPEDIARNKRLLGFYQEAKGLGGDAEKLHALMNRQHNILDLEGAPIMLDRAGGKTLHNMFDADEIKSWKHGHEAKKLSEMLSGHYKNPGDLVRLLNSPTGPQHAATIRKAVENGHITSDPAAKKAILEELDRLQTFHRPLGAQHLGLVSKGRHAANRLRGGALRGGGAIAGTAAGLFLPEILNRFGPTK